jgi:transposase
VTDEQGELRDRFSTCLDEMITGDGYRLLWFHSTRKAALDATTRNRRLQQASAALAELQERLSGPRTRFRQRAQVEQAVARIREEQEVAAWLAVRVEERPRETFRQATPGRPTERTRYVKHTRPAYALSWELQHDALIEAEHDDGVFPLLTNDRTFDAEQVLRAYKRQPLIEKRFSQFKTDFAVAPVYLKNVTRIQGLLTIYFLVLLTQTLLERELRRAMAQANVPSLPMYPEGRSCTRPTTCRIVELFAPIQRHIVRRADQPAALKTTVAEDDDPILVTTLTPVQRKILRLLGLKPDDYGH